MRQLEFTCAKCGASVQVSMPRPPHPKEGGKCPKDDQGDHVWVRSK